MIITVGAEKGGVAKTTTAITLAARFVAMGASVVLVDTDSTGSASDWFNLRGETGLEKTFTVVAQPRDPAPTIVDFSSKYDVVVVDVGARDYDKHLDLLKISDYWLIPTQVGLDDLQSTMNLCEGLVESSKSSKTGSVPASIVFTRVRFPVEEEDARNALAPETSGIPLLKTSIKDRKVWRDARRAGKTIFEMTKRDREQAVEEFELLFQEIMSNLKKIKKGSGK